MRTGELDKLEITHEFIFYVHHLFVFNYIIIHTCQHHYRKFIFYFLPIQQHPYLIRIDSPFLLGPISQRIPEKVITKGKIEGFLYSLLNNIFKLIERRIDHYPFNSFLSLSKYKIFVVLQRNHCSHAPAV